MGPTSLLYEFSFFGIASSKISHTGTMVWTYNEYKWVLEHIVCTNFLSRFIKIFFFLLLFLILLTFKSQGDNTPYYT